MSNKSIDLSKEKIRYLAIGDSISEGFNSRYGVGFPGEIKINDADNTKTISGMSFPAILSKMINDIIPGSIESFDNFALTGTRVVDWLYFLGIEPKKYNYKNSKKQISEDQEYDEKENNPQINRAYKQFGMFGRSDIRDFEKLKSKIKNANFITVTIGGNDWLANFPIFEISSLQQNVLSKSEFDKIITKKNDELLINMNKLFGEIRILNPTANIVAVNYATTLSLLLNFNKEWLGKNNKIVISEYIGLLNEVVIKAAKQNNINFVNFENKKFWEEHRESLSKIFFDIHPTYYGYKKIAHEIFAKIALSNDFYNQPLEEIQKSLPNVDKVFLDVDHKKFTNIFDFSTMNFSDKKLIELSKIANDKFFWSNNSHEKEFLSLRRSLSVKKYFYYDDNSVAVNNVKSLLNSILLFIEQNNLDPENKIKLILENDKYVSLLINSFIKSDYIDIVTNQIQDELDKNHKAKTKTTITMFKSLIFSKLLDTTNVFYLLRDFGNEIIKIDNDKKFFNLIESASISILLNISDSQKYNEVFKKNIKNRAVSILCKRLKTVEHDLIEILIDNFVETKIELIIINLIKTYFYSLESISDIKSINSFLTKFINNFFKKIELKIILENIIGNDQVEYAFSETIINILEIKNYSVQDVLLFKKFIKLIVVKIRNQDVIINIFSKIIMNLVDKKNASSSFEVLWSFTGEEFWNILNASKIRKIWTNQSDIFILADVINLIFEKSSITKSDFYKTLLNIYNPKLKDNSLTANLFNIAKDLVEKMMKIEKIYLAIANTLYNSFLEFKKINPKIDNESNPYYKSYYRFVVSSLWIGHRLFQKDISINIFWNTKKGIFKSLPSIVNQIHKLSMGNSTNSKREELVNYIFGDVFVDNIKNSSLDDKDLRESMLWYIKTCDFEDDKFSELSDKKTVIFESLQKGYWKINKS